MVTKQCPNCQQHVPVACKACPCGHIFFVARRAVSIQKKGRINDGEVKRRRTERTKRERPDYFNSLQIDNELKKMKTQQKSRKKTDNPGGNEKDGEGSNSEEGSEATNQARSSSLNSKNKKRGRPKKNFSSRDKSESKVAEKEEETDMFAKLPKEKEEQFGVILSEINRKMMQQQFQME